MTCLFKFEYSKQDVVPYYIGLHALISRQVLIKFKFELKIREEKHDEYWWEITVHLITLSNVLHYKLHS